METPSTSKCKYLARANEPLQVADALVRDSDGIYFLLWQRGQGRYTGGWKINFGDIQVDARKLSKWNR